MALLSSVAVRRHLSEPVCQACVIMATGVGHLASLSCRSMFLSTYISNNLGSDHARSVQVCFLAISLPVTERESERARGVVCLYVVAVSFLRQSAAALPFAPKHPRPRCLTYPATRLEVPSRRPRLLHFMWLFACFFSDEIHLSCLP